MDFDVVIVGGGLVGASLALALRNSGLKLALIEAKPYRHETEGWDSRIYAISPGSADFLDDGWRSMDHERVEAVREMRIFGDDASSELRFSAEETGNSELAFIVESRNLLNGLMQEIGSQENLELISPASCRGIQWTENGMELELDNARLETRLIVGADGAKSWLRSQAGFEEKPSPYHQTAIVANFECEKRHFGTAWQWFRKDGILALLPMPGNRISLVWTVWTEKAESLMSSPDFERLVEEASHFRLGELKMITQPQGFPLRLLRLDSLVKPGIALVGDAAHNTHPLAGQGVNLGFRDARELSKVLIERGPQKNCGDYFLLRRFDRARREDILSMQTTTDLLQKLFNNDLPGLSLIRNMGLRVAQGQDWIKEALIRHALV